MAVERHTTKLPSLIPIQIYWHGMTVLFLCSETLMLPPAVPKSREEQGTGEGQSLAVPSCDGSKVRTCSVGMLVLINTNDNPLLQTNLYLTTLPFQF